MKLLRSCNEVPTDATPLIARHAGTLYAVTRSSHISFSASSRRLARFNLRSRVGLSEGCFGVLPRSKEKRFVMAGPYDDDDDENDDKKGD